MQEVINDTELFEALQQSGKDFDRMWRTFCRWSETHSHLGMIEGLDCITKTKNQVVLGDIGCNNRFRDIIIRRDKGWKNSKDGAE